MKPIIITDSNCDLNGDYLTDNKIAVIPIRFYLKGDKMPLIPSYNYLIEKDPDDLTEYMTYSQFYDEIRDGEIATTSQISPYDFKRYFNIYTSKGYPIIYIGFSSGLSKTLDNAILARQEIMDENKEADITIIDTKSATSGQGLLVYYAAEMLKGGSTKNEVINWIEENSLKVNVWFTVDDLEQLKRGGRISQTTANLGTLLNVKPVLRIDKFGKLVPTQRVRGRKRALIELFEQLKANIVNSKEQIIFINHGDCIEDAEYLKSLITDKIEVKDVIINYTGPVIGTHTGAGILSVAFLGTAE
jgi:DegV family protein with EDD domain